MIDIASLYDAKHPSNCAMLIYEFYRKADWMREQQADDIVKLLKFFSFCKQQNPQFYCDFHVDKDGKILCLL